MIVITGPGRSGTSVVAELYRTLGFDPGGRWYRRVRAGLEDEEIVRMNYRIARDLGIGQFQGGNRRRSVRKTVRRSIRRRSIRPLRLDARPQWDKFDSVVERYGPGIRDLASNRILAKDPRFSQTMPVWIAAGADIEHTLVCVRPIDSMVRSRIAAGQAGRASVDEVRNSLVYYFGLLMATLIEHDINYSLVRFPDFIQDPELLFQSMRFPEPVTRERFLDAFARVVQPDLVHEDS